MNDESGEDIQREIEAFIRKQEIGKVIDTLSKKGNESPISDNEYWSNLYLVARDHKMRDREMSLGEKAKNGCPRN